MKKIISLLTVTAILLACLTLCVSADAFAPVQGTRYHADDLAGAEAGAGGFSFFTAAKGNYKPAEKLPASYKVGQYDSIMWENAELANYGVSAQFWNNGADAGFKIFPNGNQVVVEYKSPAEGKLVFDLEAGFEANTGSAGSAIRLIRADGTQLGNVMNITASAPESWGSYLRDAGNNKASYEVEVVKDEKVYLYIEDTGTEACIMTHLWIDLTYSRLGPKPVAAKLTPEEGTVYHLNDLAGKLEDNNGISFYACAKGTYDPGSKLSTAYKVGQYDSMMWENGSLAQYGVSAQFWNNGDTGFKMFPDSNQIILAYRSEVAGNVTFDLEAGFEKGEGAPGSAIRLLRANGKQIGETLNVTVTAPEEWGSYNRDAGNNKASLTFEIGKNETVYLYVEDTATAGLFTTHLWVDMVYNRVGEAPGGATGDVLPAFSALAVLAAGAVILVRKKHD